MCFSCRLLMPRFTAAVPLIACLLFIFVMATLLRTALCDPGIIPRATAQEASDTERHIGTVTFLVLSFPIVASLTEMVRRYWSKFSHVPLAIIRYPTAQLCLHIMSLCDIIMSHCDIEYKQILHVLIGWGDTVGVASHSWRDVIIVSFRASKM